MVTAYDFTEHRKKRMAEQRAEYGNKPTEQPEKPKGAEPPFTPYPHNWHNRLLPLIDSLSELKVTEHIIRQTLGWRDKPEDIISFSQFEKALNLSRPMVQQGLDAGVARGSIIRRAVGNSFAYRVDLDAEYTSKKESGRGKHFKHPTNQDEESVKTLNQLSLLTGKDNTPIAVKTLNQNTPKSVKTLNTQKKVFKENIKENMPHSRPSDFLITEFYKSQLQAIEQGNPPLTELGNKKTSTGVLTELINELYRGKAEPGAVAKLGKEIGNVWAFYDFIWAHTKDKYNGNGFAWLMKCAKNARASPPSFAEKQAEEKRNETLRQIANTKFDRNAQYDY